MSFSYCFALLDPQPVYHLLCLTMGKAADPGRDKLRQNLQLEHTPPAIEGPCWGHGPAASITLCAIPVAVLTTNQALREQREAKQPKIVHLRLIPK